MSDYDRQQWQDEENARNAALDKQREREAKARERSARNARRKLERLHRTLKENGDITDFEDEFSESVSERLDKFGSAFHDRQLGRPGDALSSAQKRVVAAMNRKVKDAKKAAKQAANPDTEDDTSERRANSSFKRSSFKSKRKYTPRVRQLDEEFDDTLPPEPVQKVEPFIPTLDPEPARPPVGKPFLRIISNDD
jgi:hypothetical protein